VDSEQDDHGHRGASRGASWSVWEIILAERDEGGEWHTVGQPVPDAHFEALDHAQAYADSRNHRQFGRGFDWLVEPARGWIAVRVRTARSVTAGLDRPSEWARAE
jgi:hypothetical protein